MTPAGFPHSDIHGSKPACGSPWLFAAYHVFLRRPVPWHPPCALSNLIVTKLSSCQRFSLIRFSPETNCKIVAFLRVSSDTFATGFFTRCFPSGCAVFKVHQVSIARSLKTIQVQEEEQSFDHLAMDFSLFQPFGCHTDCSVYRPGMNLRVSSSILSLERR